MLPPYLRFLLRLLLYPVILLLSIVLILLLLFRFTSIQETALSTLTGSIYEETGWEVTLNDVRGFLPFHLHASMVTLEKKGVAKAQVDQVEIVLSPLDLLRGTLAFSFVDIDRPELTFYRSEKAKNTPAVLSTPMTLPDPLEIHAFTVRNLSWKEEGASFSIPITVRGSIYTEPSKNIATAEVAISTSSTLKSATELKVEVFPEGNRIYAILEVKDSPKGLILSNLSLPYQPNLDLKTTIETTPQACIDLFTGKIPENTELCSFGIEIQSTLKEGNSNGKFHLEAETRLDSNGIWQVEEVDGQLQLPDLSIPPIRIEGKAQIDLVKHQTDGLFHLDPISIDPLSKWISGTVLGQVHIHGPLSKPSCLMTLSAEALTFGNQPFEEIISKLDLQSNDGNIFGQWTLNGTAQGKELRGAAKLSFSRKNGYSIQDLELILPFGKAIGSVHSASSSTFEGSAAFTINEWPKLFDDDTHQIRGKTKGQLKWTVDNSGAQQTAFTVEMDEPSFGSWHAKSALGEATVLHLFSEPIGTITLSGQEVLNGSASWQEISISTDLKGTDPSSFFAMAKGAWHGESAAIARGEWQATARSFAVTLESLDGKLASHPFQMEGEWRVEHSAKHWIFSPLRLALETAHLEAAATISENFLEGRLYGVGIPLELIGYLFPAELYLDGTGDLICNVSGSLSNVEGTVEIAMEDMRLQEESFATFPSLSGELKAYLQKDSLAISTSLQTPSREPITLEGSLPMHLSLSPFKVEIHDQSPLYCDLSFEGEISPLLQLLVTDTTSFSGTLKADLKLTGQLDSPSLLGNMSIQNGVYESLDTGAMFQGISANFEGRGSTVVLTELTAKDTDAGSLIANGELEMDFNRRLPFSLAMYLNHAELIHRDYAEVTATGSLKFSGNLDQGAVDGTLTLDESTVTIPKDIPPRLRSVDVTYVNIDKNKIPSANSIRPHEKWPLALNVQLEAPQKVFVRGRELNSEWGGKISIKGSTKSPELHGTMQVKHGNLMFNGKEFTTKEGSINFFGNPQSQITIYVVAERQIEEIRAQAVLKGPLKNPELSFRSTPPLSEKEVLSWLLFNRPPSEISPTQGEELRETVFTLSTGREDRDVLSRIRQTIGIDRLDISSQESDDANEVTVRVGKYLSRGVYVSVGQNINSEVRQLAIEAKLIQDFKLEGEIGDNSEGKISLKWERDY